MGLIEDLQQTYLDIQKRLTDVGSNLAYYNNQYQINHFGGQTPSQFASFIGPIQGEYDQLTAKAGNVVNQIQQEQLNLQKKNLDPVPPSIPVAVVPPPQATPGDLAGAPGSSATQTPVGATTPAAPAPNSISAPADTTGSGQPAPFNLSIFQPAPSIPTQAPTPLYIPYPVGGAPQATTSDNSALLAAAVASTASGGGNSNSGMSTYLILAGLALSVYLVFKK